MVEFELQLNKTLLELFKQHGTNGFFIEEESAILLDKCIKAHCHIIDKTSGETSLVQLDVAFNIGLDKMICESCAGFGSNVQEAVNDSFSSFVRNSFHTIFAAFFSSEYDDQISRNTWLINTVPYEVISSSIGIRGNKPENLSTKWISQFKEEIEKKSLDKGINWIRLFYAISNNQITACEVLVNNENDTSLQNIANKFEVNLTEEFYTLRLFYILQSGLDIGRLAAVISWASLIDEENDFEVVQNILKSFGMSELDIEKAYIFIPLAISHVFIEGIAPNALKTKAIVVNSDKQFFEINLKDEPLFSKSYEWAKDSIGNNLIQQESLIGILQMSSLFNTLNEALHKGLNTEDLEFSETVMMLKNYIGEEQDKVNFENPKAKKKPFWKFW